MRRFESVIYFPMPGEKERQALWKISFPKIKPEEEKILLTFGKLHELSGGNITSAAHFASMLAYTRLKKMREKLNSVKSLTIEEKMEIEKEISSPKIKTDEILEAIKREYAKEKKSFPRDDSRYAKAI
jgi:SpoVK/Ycf46/Vps4 family AAA+-type ATPase